MTDKYGNAQVKIDPKVKNGAELDYFLVNRKAILVFSKFLTTGSLQSFDIVRVQWLKFKKKDWFGQKLLFKLCT